MESWMCGSAGKQIEKPVDLLLLRLGGKFAGEFGVVLYMQAYESLEQAVWLEHSPRLLVGWRVEAGDPVARAVTLHPWLVTSPAHGVELCQLGLDRLRRAEKQPP